MDFRYSTLQATSIRAEVNRRYEGSASLNRSPAHSRSKSIRLLKILPRGREDTILRCSIRHFLLDNAPRYSAISYTWQPVLPRQHIEIDGAKLSIGYNLWTFLMWLSANGQFEYLWADSISINQEDVEEKNYQVSFMGDIYRQASKGLI
jgi:hypothetical protein